MTRPNMILDRSQKGNRHARGQETGGLKRAKLEIRVDMH